MERIITVAEVQAACADLIRRLPIQPGKPCRMYGIPRGGTIVAFMIANQFVGIELVERPEEADFFVDDIWDTGATAKRFYEQFGAPTYALFDKARDPRWKGQWLVLPWETTDPTKPESDTFLRVLQFIGEDATRSGLKETPARAAAYFKDATVGYTKKPADVLKDFADGAERVDQMVFQGAIPFFSMCEHHMAPFFGVVHIGYIPNGKVLGLSKFARLVDVFARRLQVQERLTNQIADALWEWLIPEAGEEAPIKEQFESAIRRAAAPSGEGVGVTIRARHLCMESRGVQKIGTVTYTSALRGSIKNEPSAREEFMGFVKLADAAHPNI